MITQFDLSAGLHAGPITYKLAPDRKQFMVIAPGGHIGLGSTLGDYVIAYTLPDTVNRWMYGLRRPSTSLAYLADQPVLSGS